MLSHVVCSTIAFHLGSLHGSSGTKATATSSLLSLCPTDSNSLQWTTATADRRQEEATTNTAPVVSSDKGSDRDASFGARGTGMMGRVPRDDFLKAFDLGMPWERGSINTSPGDRDYVLLLYPTTATVDDKQRLKHQQHLLQQESAIIAYSSVEEALQQQSCNTLKIVVTDTSSACVAVVAGPANDSYHVHKWMRVLDRPNSKLKKKKTHQLWRPVGRYGGTQASLQEPPKPVTTKESLQLLQEYLSIQDAVLDELRPVAAKVARATGTVVVMVCNAGHAELLLNFYCAAISVGVDLSSFLLFCTDLETKLLADNSLPQLTSYYNKQLFASIPAGDKKIEYGTKTYARVMMSKVYCVHLISSLGHDLFFQDVDLVPYRKDYTEHFIEAAKATNTATAAGDDFDMYFQFDHSHAPLYLPWSANSGFFYARSNAKTRFFFSALLRLGDMILRTKSHQAVMAALLSEHSSLFGLRAKTMHEESHHYPGTSSALLLQRGKAVHVRIRTVLWKPCILLTLLLYHVCDHNSAVGYHFHRDRPFMKDMIQGKIHPYVFHMNWNSDKETKRKFNEQLGDWFVKDSCTDQTVDELTRLSSSGDCCVTTEPVVVCHFRDKPSKIRCDDSPLIEDKTSFW